MADLTYLLLATLLFMGSFGALRAFSWLRNVGAKDVDEPPHDAGTDETDRA